MFNRLLVFTRTKRFIGLRPGLVNSLFSLFFSICRSRILFLSSDGSFLFFLFYATTLLSHPSPTDCSFGLVWSRKMKRKTLFSLSRTLIGIMVFCCWLCFLSRQHFSFFSSQFVAIARN